MIPLDFVTEWRAQAPWVQDAQVEQDLVLTRALVEIFSSDAAPALAFRGGTALNKLHMKTPARYSEDIDLVQVDPGPIGNVLDGIRARLDPWLGKPRRSLKDGRAVLVYRMQSEGPAAVPMRLKVEINTREHFSVYDLVEQPFEVSSRWFTGGALIQTYALDELLGTKLRALYQRKKGRDLFDLWRVNASLNPTRIVECFQAYLKHQGLTVSRAQFEQNLAEKLSDPRFTTDMTPLLAPNTTWRIEAAAEYVRTELLNQLPGDAWKGEIG